MDYVIVFLSGAVSTLLVKAIWLSLKRTDLTELPATWREISGCDEEIVVGGKTYRGSCTVWYEYPSGRRCPTSTETQLHEIAQRESWKVSKR